MPQYARWYQVITEDNVPELDETENWLVSAVAARVITDDLGAPAPGYFLVTTNSPPTAPPRVTDVNIDTLAGGGSVNASTLHARHDLQWDPALVTYPVVRQTVLAFSRAFEPLWCDAGPWSLSKGMHMSDYKQGPVLTPCWMIHLSPPLAQRITPPPTDVISERFADGSLFLSVTDQTFDPDDPKHLDAAHRLFAILDTLKEKKQPHQWRR